MESISSLADKIGIAKRRRAAISTLLARGSAGSFDSAGSHAAASEKELLAELQEVQGELEEMESQYEKLRWR